MINDEPLPGGRLRRRRSTSASGDRRVLGNLDQIIATLADDPAIGDQEVPDAG